MSRRNLVQIAFGLIFGGAMIAVAWVQFQDANARSSEAIVLLAADSYLRTLEAVRDVYTSEVVNRLPDSVLVTYDYDHYDNAVPLPATFAMALAESNTKKPSRSDLPAIRSRSSRSLDFAAQRTPARSSSDWRRGPLTSLSEPTACCKRASGFAISGCSSSMKNTDLALPTRSESSSSRRPSTF